MAATSFQSIPRFAFLLKMLLPAAVALVLGIAGMGKLADPAVFQPKPVLSSSGTVELPESLQGAAQGGIHHWRTIFFFGTHLPEVCLGDNAVSEFQKKQCTEFWERLRFGAALSLLPFAFCALFLRIAFAALRRVYRAARRRVSEGKSIGQGVVTQPAEAPQDLFSLLYGLQPVGVQLTRGPQIKVYLAKDDVMPRPGQTLLVYEPFPSLGSPRHFAVLYTPHVAVISGVKRA